MQLIFIQGFTKGGRQVRFHVILFNYQNKYLEAGATLRHFSDRVASCRLPGVSLLGGVTTAV